jgi:small conductance mechanosensitive channel
MDASTLLRDLPFSVGVVIALVLVLGLADRIMDRQARVTKFTRQLTLILLTVLAGLIALLVLPDSIAPDQTVIQLVGIAATVVVTLGSTTLVSNAMAGLMLRSVRSFRPGDFIKVDDHLGRVSERGLFHVEIQTIHRDLITLPNQFLITRPMRVVRHSGTVITADVSLAYDVAHQLVEPLLMEAAERAGLEESFVQVITLGDYTVAYRIAGFLSDVKSLFTAQSTLRRRVLDTLHNAGVEIASPMLMGHRALSETEALVPKIDKAVLAHREEEESAAPSDLIFDKAEEAELDDRAQQELETLRDEVKALKQEAKKAAELDKSKLGTEIDALQAEIEVVEAEFEARDDDAEMEEED